MGNSGPNPDNPSGHLVVKMAILGKSSHFLTQILTKQEKLFFVDYAPGHFMECVFPGFLLKIHPDSAWIFTKMSPDEELDTLFLVNFNIFPCLHINFSLFFILGPHFFPLGP